MKFVLARGDWRLRGDDAYGPLSQRSALAVKDDLKAQSYRLDRLRKLDFEVNPVPFRPILLLANECWALLVRDDFLSTGALQQMAHASFARYDVGEAGAFLAYNARALQNIFEGLVDYPKSCVMLTEQNLSWPNPPVVLAEIHDATSADDLRSRANPIQGQQIYPRTLRVQGNWQAPFFYFQNHLFIDSTVDLEDSGVVSLGLSCELEAE